MLSRQIIALLVLFFAATTLAGHKKIRPGEPQTTCLIDESGEVRDAYTIRGRNWNVTEDQFKSAVNSPGAVLTAWEWRAAIDEDRASVFKAKVRSICSYRTLGDQRRLSNADTHVSSGHRLAKKKRPRRNWRSLSSRSPSRSSVGNRAMVAVRTTCRLETMRFSLPASGLSTEMDLGSHFEGDISRWLEWTETTVNDLAAASSF